jgi:hypothetical protein
MDTYHKNNCLLFAAYLGVQTARIMRDFTFYSLHIVNFKADVTSIDICINLS